MKISDEKLLNLCEEFGKRTLYWRRKFIGLLPEVDKRRLFEKKGFNSIFEFAYKLAGLSEKQVRLVLNLGHRFKDKPSLKAMLENGEVSVNKLSRVVSIATAENEEKLAEKVKILPQKALETLARDIRIQKGYGTAQIADESLRAQTQFKISLPNFQLSDEVIEKLNHLHSLGHDVNTVILGMLERRKSEIEAKKEELAQAEIAKLKTHKKLKISNYIPVKVRAILKEEHGSKCSIPGCHKPAKESHHTQRLALAKIHDPRYIAPLCREHHQIAHLIDQKYIERQPGSHIH